MTRQLRVLIVHNRYQQRGGEDSVVDAEAALLRSAGHEVKAAVVDNVDIATPFDKARVLVASSWNAGRFEWMNALVADFRPDIIHIHNFFPLLSPSIHAAAARSGAGVVQTLHNYRILCGNALFLRGGQLCERCLGGSKMWGVVFGCYRGSRIGSAAVAAMQTSAAARGIWNDCVDRFIALTAFARDKFIEGGLPAKAMVIKPNFVDRTLAPPNAEARSGGLFVGRISSEKGLEPLLEARAMSGAKDTLRIIGDGPDRLRLERTFAGMATFLGHQDADVVNLEMLKAQYLVIPSIWYEGFPMVVVEAFAVGLPVLASKLGSLAEIVTDGVDGLHFAPGNSASLAIALGRMADPVLTAALGRGAYAKYRSCYTPAINIELIETIYGEAMQAAALRLPHYI